MRALFTSNPAYGTWLPLTPIARAMVDAGHDVAFATSSSVSGPIEEAGFRWLRAGAEPDDSEGAALQAKLLELPNSERRRFTYEEIFGGYNPRRMVPDLLAAAEAWRPDLVVRSCHEYGAMVAAELLDIPHVKVEIHAAGDLPHLAAMVSEPLQRLRATFGLPERSIQSLMEHYLVLTPFPVSLNTVGNPIVATAHHLRAMPADSTDSELLAWIDALGSLPLIYVSLGTVVRGARSVEILSTLLAGLREIEAEVVVTVGHHLDPAALGPQPSHIHLERFLPLGALLPRCSLVLFHGGSGTLGGAVAHGLPMVIFPISADQPDNAARCAELGASRTLDQEHLTPEHVREVVLDVLHTPTYRQAAERLRDEFNALPGPEFAVELLERLARDKAPIIAVR